MGPEVSVVMSVYNDAAHLRDCLESVLSQGRVRFELIAIDDGSTDCSGQILEEFAARDSRLRLVRQRNQGLTRSLITGCGLAEGRYIARQDSDDVSFPGRLRKLANVLDSFPQVVLTASACAMMGPNGELLLDVPAPTHSVGSQEPAFCHGSLMFRRDAYEHVGGYRREFCAAQDIDLQLRLSEVGDVRVVPDLLYAYRISENSVSAASPIQKRLSRLATAARDARMTGQDEASILENAMRLSSGESTAIRAERGTDNYFIGRCLYARRDRRALPYLWSSAKARPLSLRAWLGLAQAFLLARSTRGHDIFLSGILPRHAGKSGHP